MEGQIGRGIPAQKRWSQLPLEMSCMDIGLMELGKHLFYQM